MLACYCWTRTSLGRHLTEPRRTVLLVIMGDFFSFLFEINVVCVLFYYAILLCGYVTITGWNSRETNAGYVPCTRLYSCEALRAWPMYVAPGFTNFGFTYFDYSVSLRPLSETLKLVLLIAGAAW